MSAPPLPAEAAEGLQHIVPPIALTTWPQGAIHCSSKGFSAKSPREAVCERSLHRTLSPLRQCASLTALGVHRHVAASDAACRQFPHKLYRFMFLHTGVLPAGHHFAQRATTALCVCTMASRFTCDRAWCSSNKKSICRVFRDDQAAAALVAASQTASPPERPSAFSEALPSNSVDAAGNAGSPTIGPGSSFSAGARAIASGAVPAYSAGCARAGDPQAQLHGRHVRSVQGNMRALPWPRDRSTRVCQTLQCHHCMHCRSLSIAHSV